MSLKRNITIGPESIYISIAELVVTIWCMLCAESAYEWHKREKQELARELNGEFPSRCLWKCPECGTVNVGKENVVDWTVKKCRRCQKMTLIMNLPYKVGARS